MASKWQGKEYKGNSKSLTFASNTYYFIKWNSLLGASADFKDEETCKKVVWDSAGFRLYYGVQAEIALNPEPMDIDAMLQFLAFTGEFKVSNGIDDST